MPLPLKAEVDVVEFVALLRSGLGICLAHVGLLICAHRVAAAVAILVDTHHRPVLDPVHGVEVHDTPYRAYILEVDKPVLAAVGSIDPAALMGTVDVGVALGKHYLALIRAPRALGAEYGFPAGGHSSGRRHYIVIAVALVEFCSLDGHVHIMSVIHDFGLTYQALAVRSHLTHGKHTLQIGAAPGKAPRHVGLPVLVPERAGIDYTLGAGHELQWRPRALGVLGLGHEYAQVGVAVIYVEFAVVVAYRRSPHCIAVVHTILDEYSLVGETVDSIPDDSPVDQILGVKNRQTGHTVEARRGHIEVIADAHHIGIGIVGIDNRILVLAVAEVGHPYFAQFGSGMH